MTGTASVGLISWKLKRLSFVAYCIMAIMGEDFITMGEYKAQVCNPLQFIMNYYMGVEC